MIKGNLKIKYNTELIALIKQKLISENYTTDNDILKIGGYFYKACFQDKYNVPAAEIFENYSGEKDYLFTKPLKKISFIILKESSIFEFKNKSYDNPKKLGHYGYDFKNKVFYSARTLYFIKDLLQSQDTSFATQFINDINIITAYYSVENNTFYFSKKPKIDEFFCSEFDEDSYIEETFTINGIKVPKWLYITPAKELNPQDFLLLNNADIKAEFVKKIRIDRLAELGTIIDSYKNYPDNEMWVKSEYKIIDMHEIIPPRKIIDNFGFLHGTEKPKYAPFLYMKNQTTGVYHLEGLHPRCKTLYDAIKMRYNGLNIKDYDIKDIK